jgi:hypothetical protein
MADADLSGTLTRKKQEDIQNRTSIYGKNHSKVQNGTWSLVEDQDHRASIFPTRKEKN